MTLPSRAVPLRDHRARLQQYLGGIVFSFTSVAGRIIEERLPARSTRDAVRPSLVLWACGANGGDLADALPVAAAFELFDRFMLLHDELADESAATVARWGLGQSLNAGDAFYALAFRSLASDVSDAGRRIEAAKLVGQAILGAIERSDGEEQRSAGLTAAALHAGALVAGAPERVTRVYARAGRLLGMAALAEDAGLAHRIAEEAVATLRSRTNGRDLEAFEEVALYVARRTA
jgi:geranylgeranyl pyrophosphate synthase